MPSPARISVTGWWWSPLLSDASTLELHPHDDNSRSSHDTEHMWRRDVGCASRQRCGFEYVAAEESEIKVIEWELNDCLFAVRRLLRRVSERETPGVGKCRNNGRCWRCLMLPAISRNAVFCGCCFYCFRIIERLMHHRFFVRCVVWRVLT